MIRLTLARAIPAPAWRALLRLALAWLQLRAANHPDTHPPAECAICRYRNRPDLETRP